MWILFGINYHTVENEPQVYFIGVFDTLDLANKEIQNLGSTKDINDFFVKEVIMNHVYDLAWSNDG